MKAYFAILLCSLTLVHCTKESEKTSSVQSSKPENVNIDVKISDSEIDYLEFKPDSISNVKIKGFEVISSYSYDQTKFVTGYYNPVDGKTVAPDTEKDNGQRLLVLNNKNEIIFKGQGGGDTYLYQPHFYKNKSDNKILIVCQLAFEYFFGGEVFLLENNSVKYVGNIDLEPFDMETSMTEVLKIYEKKNAIHFKFDSDSLLLKPGNEDIKIKNNDTEYIYEKGVLKFKK